VHQGQLKLADTLTMRPADRSVCVQPTADKAVSHGPYRASIDALMTSMIVDSDCAATDLLIAHLGGPAAVQAVLTAEGLSGVRVDRDERRLQTEIEGLTWRAAYAEPAVLKRAEAAVLPAKRDAAFAAYLKDPRDTATPAGMTILLQRLDDGQLLSPASTAHLLKVMSETRTGPDRLKAGLPAGWRLAHKTGTSGVHRGVSAALNDVGVLTAPDGGKVMVAAFVSDTRSSADAQARLIASLARAVADSYVPAAR
jgi:beta-lactamase class A